MSKERLSKLQKWILQEIYKSEEGYITSKNVYEGFYKIKDKVGIHFEYHPYKDKEDSLKAQRAYPAFLASIKNLMKKGLVKKYFYHHTYKIDRFIEASYGKHIKLTPEGEEKAKSLIIQLGVNHPELNNKD